MRTSAIENVHVEEPKPISLRGLEGRRAAMVTFSKYPDDPRPRRAADALIEQGMSVDLICIHDLRWPKKEVAGNIRVTRLPIKHRRGGKFSYIYNYAAFILASSLCLAWRSLRRPYDLVHVHNMPDVLVISALVPKIMGAKVILDMHDPMPELMTTIFNRSMDSRAVRLLRWLEKWSMKQADLVVTVNIACKRIFESRSCPAEKISVVMNSPDDRIFPLRSPGSYRVDAGSRGRRFAIMYHGSIVERNGLDLAIEALSLVKRTISGAELRIYGVETPFLGEVMELARRKGIAKAVHYLGPKRLEDLVAEIERCDVGIIPNHRNTFTEINTPTRILEYLALGKPVIAPRATGICDYFDDTSLILFELGNAEDLARKLEAVFFHPAKARKIAERGQAVYREHAWPAEKARLTSMTAGLLNSRLSVAARAS